MLKAIILTVSTLFGLLGAVEASTMHPTEYRGFNKLKKHIFEAETRTGISAELLTALLSIESGMGRDTSNPYSRAGGVMQYTPSTWRNDLTKYHKTLGLSANASVHNPRAAILVAAAALADNKVYLKKVTGQPVITNGDLYMTHFIGLYGTAKLLNSYSNKPINQIIAVNDNNGGHYQVKGKVATAREFRRKMNTLVKSEANRYTAVIKETRLDNLMYSLNKRHTADLYGN